MFNSYLVEHAIYCMSIATRLWTWKIGLIIQFLKGKILPLYSIYKQTLKKNKKTFILFLNNGIQFGVFYISCTSYTKNHSCNSPAQDKKIFFQKFPHENSLFKKKSMSEPCLFYYFQINMSVSCVLLYFLVFSLHPYLIDCGNGCNEAVCASIVSKCQLTQSCKCDAKNTTCHKDCFYCLDFLYLECCSCVGGYYCFVLVFVRDWSKALLETVTFFK